MKFASDKRNPYQFYLMPPQIALSCNAICPERSRRVVRVTQSPQASTANDVD